MTLFSSSLIKGLIRTAASQTIEWLASPRWPDLAGEVPACWQALNLAWYRAGRKGDNEDVFSSLAFGSPLRARGPSRPGPGKLYIEDPLEDG